MSPAVITVIRYALGVLATSLAGVSAENTFPAFSALFSALAVAVLAVIHLIPRSVKDIKAAPGTKILTEIK